MFSTLYWKYKHREIRPVCLSRNQGHPENPDRLGKKGYKDFQREEELWLETVTDGKLFVNRLQLLPVEQVRLREAK
jgi:hypothetical protein